MIQARGKTKNKNCFSQSANSKKEHFILAYDVFQYSGKLFSNLQKISSVIPPIFLPLVEGKRTVIRKAFSNPQKSQRRSKLFYIYQSQKATPKGAAA